MTAAAAAYQDDGDSTGGGGSKRDQARSPKVRREVPNVAEDVPKERRPLLT